MPADPVGRYTCLQWLMFQMGGVGPMFGQYNHFANYCADKLAYPIQRYTNEVQRLHRVLDKRLSEADYLPAPNTASPTSPPSRGSATPTGVGSTSMTIPP